MKAAVLRTFGSPLTIETLPDPVLGTGEVIVDVVALPVLISPLYSLSGDNAFCCDWPLERGRLETAVSREVLCRETLREYWGNFAWKSASILQRTTSLSVRYDAGRGTANFGVARNRLGSTKPDQPTQLLQSNRSQDHFRSMLLKAPLFVELRWAGFERAGRAEPAPNEQERQRSPVSCRSSAAQDLPLLSPFQWERGIAFKRFGGQRGWLGSTTDTPHDLWCKKRERDQALHITFRHAFSLGDLPHGSCSARGQFAEPAMTACDRLEQGTIGP